MNPKILIVEDDKYLVGAYQAKFSRAGFTVEVALDGEDAFKKLETFKADLILLDLIMPRKDGFEFLFELRSHPELKGIPVIVASNLGQKDSVAKVKELGVTEYILKTNMSLDDLVTRIKAAVAKK